MARRKSYDDIQNQFEGIKKNLLEGSDAYKSLTHLDENDEGERATRLKQAEEAIFNKPTEGDYRIARRIDAAYNALERYKRNILKKGGFHKTDEIFEPELRGAIRKWKEKKFSRNVYMGLGGEG